LLLKLVGLFNNEVKRESKQNDRQNRDE